MYKDRVYQKICDYLPGTGPEIFDKMVRIYVDRKGQYRRPSYVLLWSILYGGKIEDAILPAAIQQASEDWILMHDDWMDSNELRRGGPSAHKVFGDVYAINAGDALNVIMWNMAFDASRNLNGTRGNRYFKKIYDMMYVTTQGQFYDTSLTRTKDILHFTMEDYYQSIHAKAAYYTVYGPMQAGALIANQSDELVNRIPEYGIPVGTAFQIKDDILDCSSTAEVLGKTIGNDVMEGVKTIILWHAVHNSSTATLNRLKEIYSKPRVKKTKDDVAFVLNLFKEVGSLDFAEKEAIKFSDEAVRKFDALNKNIPESPVKALARESIGYVVKRKA